MCRIFIVDDEPLIRATLETIFKQAGFDAIGFSDPSEALRAVNANCPDLVLTDFEMPRLNGIELATLIQADHPECKVVLFTGNPDVPFCVENTPVLMKPMEPGTLLQCLKARLGGGVEECLGYRFRRSCPAVLFRNLGTCKSFMSARTHSFAAAWRKTFDVDLTGRLYARQPPGGSRSLRGTGLSLRSR